MKLSEVVSQLQLVIPKYSDYFSNTLSISSIVASANVATVVTNTAHGLITGRGVTISEVVQHTIIDSVSRDGLVFTFTTTNKHDLTYGFPGYETVTLGGFTDGNWNDSFTLLEVTDRNTFKVRSTIVDLPVLNTNEYLTEIRVDGVNGRYPVTLVDPTTFTVPGTFNDGTYTSGTVKSGVRIAGSVSIERALEEYTKQSLTDMWMFVVMSDASVSKNRNAYNDAVATIANGEDIRTRLIDGFSIYLMKNTKNDIAAVDAIDICRHTLLSPILKSVFGAVFSTGLNSAGDFKTILIGHSLFGYTKAVLIYQYGFQYVEDITSDDSVNEDDTRAFSEIDYTHSMGDSNTEDLTVLDLELPE